MAGLDLAASARSIGRYFSIVSAIPAALLVLFGFLLLSSGAWQATPDWGRAFSAVISLGLGGIAALSALSLAVSLVMHPLQFALVQVYEGYWGMSAVARKAALLRTLRYVKDDGDAEKTGKTSVRAAEVHKSEVAKGAERRIWLEQLEVSATRLEQGFPKHTHRSMPTRLGNVLRRYEDLAGAPYGLDALTAVPFLALVAPDKDVEYLDDQRRNLDLAVRMSATSLLAALLCFVFLWNDGLWFLITLGPYGLAYLFYRGAVVAAVEYGISMSTLIALNRFALYERMHLKLPADPDAEYRNENLLQPFLDLKPGTEDSYVHPEPEPWQRQLVDRGREDRGTASREGDDAGR